MTSPAQALERLAEWGDARSWVGPDPYEGLNTPLGRLAFGFRPQQAVTQLYKRLPVTPPWPLRTPARPNPKALALALSGYATPVGRGLAGAERFLEDAPRTLEQLALRDGERIAWSYPFEVRTRSIHYGPETPNAISTCFCVHALLDAGEALSDPGPVELALRARGPLAGLITHGSTGPYYAYVGSGSELIHNANAMVAGTLARLHRVEADDRIADDVREATATTAGALPASGVWPYGERSDLAWSDNFHTAYVLDGLRETEQTFGVGGNAYAEGLGRWRDAFFEEDGAARMYPDRRFPLEAHCYASAIDTLCVAIDAPWATEFAERVAASAIAELWLEREGRFAHRRNASGLNKRAFMRWTNAPMFRALCRLGTHLVAQQGRSLG